MQVALPAGTTDSVVLACYTAARHNHKASSGIDSPVNVSTRWPAGCNAAGRYPDPATICRHTFDLPVPRQAPLRADTKLPGPVGPKIAWVQICSRHVESTKYEN